MIKAVICPKCGTKNSSKNRLCNRCKNNLLLNNRYRLVKMLGKSVVTTYLALDIDTKKGVIIKELSLKKIDNWKTEELFDKEVNVLSRLEYQAIPHFIDSFSEGVGADQKKYLITEYIKGINLEKERESKTYEISEIFKIVLEISKILDYLHSFNPPIIHRDLKTSNLLRDKNDKISLIDFSNVKSIVNQETGATIIGTFGYMAPEQFSGRASKKSDFYSLGVIALVLFTKEEPENMMNDDNALVWKNHIELKSSIENSNFKLLLEKLLEKTEEKRISSSKEIENIINNKKSIEKEESRKSIKGSKLINNRYRLVKKIKSEGIVDIFIAKDIKNKDKSVLVNRLIIDEDDEDIDDSIISDFKKDAERLKKVDDKGVPKYIEIEYMSKDDKHIFYSVQKRVGGSSIEKIVNKNLYEELDLNRNISKIILSILKTLKYLESVSIINGNITSKNILVKKDLSISLINFGIIENVARKIDEDNNISAYIAPEKLEDHETPKSDQYSVGVSLIHLVTKKDPNSIQTFYKKIQFKDHSKFGKHINDTISTLVDPRPRYRFENLENTTKQLDSFSKGGFFNTDYSSESFETGFAEEGLELDDFNSALADDYKAKDSLINQMNYRRPLRKGKITSIHIFAIVGVSTILFVLTIFNKKVKKSKNSKNDFIEQNHSFRQRSRKSRIKYTNKQINKRGKKIDDSDIDDDDL